jgi:hypothetical protein
MPGKHIREHNCSIGNKLQADATILDGSPQPEVARSRHHEIGTGKSACGKLVLPTIGTDNEQESSNRQPSLLTSTFLRGICRTCIE